MRTDTRSGLSADYYEKRLGAQKSSEEIEQNRSDAFEQKYATKLNAEYQKAMSSFPVEVTERDGEQQKTRAEKEREVFASFNTLRSRLEGTLEGFGERQKLILRLKLARHFQNNETIDENTLYDAIIESPRFLDSDKGSFFRLLEVHEEKTLMRIAEMRKRKAEETGEGFNPYEALYTTESGKYYVTRLLNMPHLEEESAYMNHCVGTSYSYVNRLKNGEIEILSFRNVPTIDKGGNKMNADDTPILTIEYNLKTKTIEQMRKHDDGYLSPDDPYYRDVIDALKQLRATATDTGETRDFTKISKSELGEIAVDDYRLLTEQGEVSIDDFDPESGIFVLKVGRMDITSDMPKEKAVKIVAVVEKIACTPEEIAYTQDEICEDTKVYIGTLEADTLQNLPETCEHIYTSFPDEKITLKEIELKRTIRTGEGWIAELKRLGDTLSNYSESMLRKLEFVVSEQSEWMRLVHISVGSLGFRERTTYAQIVKRAQELGLEVCPPDVGPEYRAQYRDQSMGEWLWIAMESITDSDGNPSIFSLGHVDDGLRLYDNWVNPGSGWYPDSLFVFRLRKSEP